MGQNTILSPNRSNPHILLSNVHNNKDSGLYQQAATAATFNNHTQFHNGISTATGGAIVNNYDLQTIYNNYVPTQYQNYPQQTHTQGQYTYTGGSVSGTTITGASAGAGTGTGTGLGVNGNGNGNGVVNGLYNGYNTTATDSPNYSPNHNHAQNTSNMSDYRVWYKATNYQTDSPTSSNTSPFRPRNIVQSKTQEC